MCIRDSIQMSVYKPSKKPFGIQNFLTQPLTMIYPKNNLSYARGCPQLLQTASFLHKDYLLHSPVHRNTFRRHLKPAAFNWYFRKVIPPASFRQIYPHETASRYSFSSSLILSASCFWPVSYTHLYSQVLVHSTVVNSRLSHRYIPINSFFID